MTNALQIGKKAFTWSVVVTTIFWSMGIAALVPVVANAETCPALQAGELFKVKGVSSVYLLDSAMKRLYFPHSSVYQTWYDNYSGVVEIPSSCVDAYPAPSAAPFGVNYRPGSRMVKVQISDSVYVVEPGNKISKIGSEAVAKELYGTTWNKKIADIADVFWPNYANRGAEITEAVPHNGMVIKVSGSSDVFLVKDGKKFKVDGGFSEDVQTVSQAVADKVATEATTVTKASVTTNPSQTAGGVVVVTPPGTTPPAAAGTVTIALAADTPSGTYAVSNATRVPFTKLNFTAGGGDVTVKSFKVKRGGSPAINGDFSQVNTVDPSGSLLNDIGKVLNSDNEAVFTEDLVIPAGTTKTYTLVGDMGTVLGGNVPTLGLLSVDTDATVVGSLPLYGNPVTTNANVSLGTATLAQGISLSNVTKQVGTNDVDLASLKISVATNDFQVERIVLRNASTTNDNDVQNLELLYNNNVIATGVMKNKFLTFDLSACTTDCKLLKGTDRTYAIRGDIISGSGRTLDLDVQRAVHVLVRDLKEGYYRTPTNNATAMTNGITISQGKLNVTKTDKVPTGNIPVNSTGVQIGSFSFKVTGEPIDIRTIVVKLNTSLNGGSGLLPTSIDQVRLVEVKADGTELALTSGQDGVGAANPGYSTSTDSFTLTEGDHDIRIKGNIDTTPGDGTSVSTSIDMANTTNFDAVGVNSSETITLGTYATPSSLVNGNTMTFKTAALRVTQLDTPPTSTRAAGSSDVLVAEIELDAAGSTEDLKVSQVIVRDHTDNGGRTIDMQNIRLFVDKDGDSSNGSGTQEALSEVKNGTDSTANNDETFTFNLSGVDQFLIKAGKKLRVSVKANIAGGATTGNHVWKSTTGNDVTAIGVRTGTEVTESVVTTRSGTKVTVGASGGTVEVSFAASNATAKNYAAGTQGVTLAIFNFLATTTEGVTLESINFRQNVSSTATSSYQDYSLVYLVDDTGAVVGSQTPTSTDVMITFLDNNGDNVKDFIVPTTGSKNLTLKANLNLIGSQAQVQRGGDQIGYHIFQASHVIGKGTSTGAESVEYFIGNTNRTPDYTNRVTHYMYKSTPTVEILAAPASKLQPTTDIYKFKVTANTSDISLYKFTFDISTTGIALTKLQLVDVTDPTERVLYDQSVGAADAGIGGLYYAVGTGAGGVVSSILFDYTTTNNGTGGDRGDEKQITAGSSRTYLLRGDFGAGGVGASFSAGDSVQVKMVGDANLSGQNNNTIMVNATAVEGGADNDFIWSDISVEAGATTTHATSTHDFVNGYLVSGLASASSSAITTQY